MSAPSPSRPLRALVVALFLVSGFSSLVLETVWVRMMVLVFGSTSFAVSTVLTALMGGLALGSWLAGRRAAALHEPRHALATYGLLEGSIGLYALLLPWLTAQLPSLHAALWGVGQSSYLAFALARFLLAALLLVLPAAAMGATLPVLAQFACAGEPPSRTAVWVGRLYAVNTLGAVGGVALAGFLLLPAIGLRATNRLACVGDLALAGAALLLARSGPRGCPGTAPAAPASEPGPCAEASRVVARLALISIGISGAVGMVYQVAWTRALALVIGSSTYAFSLILACFLVGLSAGAALYASRQARHPDQAGNLGVAHLLTASGALGGALLMDRLPVLLLFLMRHIDLRPATLLLAALLLCALVLLVPTFFMGMVFPAVLALQAGPRGEPARVTGEVYAVNTLGAILGSFAGGFLLLPLLGLQRTLLCTILGSLALAALFGVLSARRPTKAGVLAGAALLGAVLLGGWRPWSLEVLTSGVFRVSRYQDLLGAGREEGKRPRPVQPEQRWASATAAALAGWEEAARRVVPPPRVLDSGLEPSDGYRIIGHRDGATAVVSVARTVEKSLSSRACWVRHALLIGGKVDASLAVLRAVAPGAPCTSLLGAELSGEGLGISSGGDAETQVLSGLLPFLLLPPGRPPATAMVIGWGSGMSVGAALQAAPRRVVAVELEAEVPRASRVFSPHNHRPEQDPRVRVIAEDGRNILASTRERFDVVISEPSNPWMSGCGNLFTSEFFAEVRRSLAPGGVFLQWLQAYEMAPENVFSILGTLADHFPSVHVFSPARAAADLLLVAQAGPRPLRWDEIATRLDSAAVARELGRIGVLDASDLLARRRSGPQGVLRVAAGAPRNTDDNARIEFAAPRDLVNYRRFSSQRILEELGRGLPDPLADLAGLPPGADEKLCRALLRAGRTGAAAAMAGRHQGLERCASLARRLSRTPDSPGLAALARRLSGHPKRQAVLAALAQRPALVAAGKLARLLDPSSADDAGLGFALIGQLLAAAEDEHRALLLLTAAWELGEEGPELRESLGRLLFARSQFATAVRLLEAGQRSGDARSLPARGSLRTGP